MSINTSYIKKLIRKYIPKSIRLLRENVYIDLMSMLGKKTSSLGMKEFPISILGKNAFYMYPFMKLKDSKKTYEYFAQFYGEATTTDFTLSKRAYMVFTAEVLSGKLIKDSAVFDINSKSVLPISLVNDKSDGNDGSLTFLSDNKTFTLNGLKENRFHYVPIDGKVEIKTNNRKCIIGDPINLKQSKITKKKLVLSIFVDGLAGSIFDENSFEKIMPNTSSYFKDGSMYFNGYASSNWTLTSVASMFSGLYPINHKIYDANNEVIIGEDYRLISEYFRDEGYLTGQICSNFRKNPHYGYMKGFDRTIYKRNMSCNDVITYALEHLRAFEGRSNYLWLTLFETHHSLHGLPDISIQANSDIFKHNYSSDKSKSVHSSYDENKTKLYIAELKRIDFYLKILYDFVKDNYDEDEVVISICSDHGKGYIADSDNMLAEHRIKAPLFFKSSETKEVTNNPFANSVDYLPTILELSGISYNKSLFDGESLISSEKNSSIAELIYINDYYRSAIYSDDYITQFVSNKKISSHKDIDFEDGELSLYSKKDMTRIDYQNNDSFKLLASNYMNLLQARIRN
jgi:hypothetical protein